MNCCPEWLISFNRLLLLPVEQIACMNRFKKKHPQWPLLLALLSWLAGTLYSHAQTRPVRSLGLSEGLSNNSVLTACKDARGFLWFGTFDGLNRYDGYGFRVYRNSLSDTFSLPSNTIRVIESDDKSNLWIGTDKGAVIFHPVENRFVRLKAGGSNGTAHPLTDVIRSIRHLGNHSTLVGTEKNGLVCFTAGSLSGTPVSLPGYPQNDYYVSAIDAGTGDSDCFVFVRKVGLCRFNARTRLLRPVNTTLRQANCIRLAFNHTLWVGTNDGLFQYDPVQNTYSRNLLTVKAKVRDLCVDPVSNKLLISSDGLGMLSIDARPGITATAAEQTALSAQLKSNSIFKIFKEDDGRIWICTLRGGISVQEPNRSYFQHVTFSEGKHTNPADNFIFCFYEAGPQDIWVGTDGAGLRLWNRQTNTTSVVYKHEENNPNSISSNFLTDITRDEQGNLWTSNWYGGVNQLIKGTNRFRHYKLINPRTGLEEPFAWLICNDRYNNLWASTTGDGALYKLNKSLDQFELFDYINDLQCLEETADRQLWGGNHTGLICIDRINKKHRVYKTGYTVRAIHEDKRGRFWVGTQDGGLLLFNRQTGSFRRYTDDDGLPSNTILRIVEDADGELWISSFNGLSRFDPQTGKFRNFSFSDGLQSNQFSYNAGEKLSGGDLIFGGINGFNLFNPAAVRDKKQPVNLLLTDILVNNEPLQKHPGLIRSSSNQAVEALRLPYDQNAVSISYVGLDYASNDNIQYAYTLEGWDKQWNYAGKLRTVNYSRLQEGRYTFKVKARNSEGHWGPEQTFLRIRVLPPWYRTWWAYTLYGLLILSAAFLYLRYTRSREKLKYQIGLEKMQREKERDLNEKRIDIFTHISHEFRTPLSLIIDPLNNAQKELRQNNYESIRQNITTAQRNARRLLSLADQLLLFRKAETGSDELHLTRLDVNQLFAGVFQCFLQLAEKKHIRYRYRHQLTTGEMAVDAEKIEIILFNLLSNAFKYTPLHGEVDLLVSEDETHVYGEVSDSGCGISETALPGIFHKFSQHNGKNVKAAGFGIGLYLVKQYVELHQGTITCTSVPGNGATFRFSVAKHLAPSAVAATVTPPGNQPTLLEELLAPGNEAGADHPAAAKMHPAEIRAEEMVTEQKSILLVDDDRESLEYLRSFFAGKYRVFTAGNGREGLQKAGSHLPDLVISDITMQEMDGLELCGQLKANAATSHIPVIILSGITNPETKLKGISCGANDFITKPYEGDLLQAKVDSLLKTSNNLRNYFLDRITLKEQITRVPAEYQDFLKRCIDCVEANLDNDDFNSKTFAREMGMSYTGLNTKIKQVSGQSTNVFIRSIRLSRAAYLMLNENLNVSQASFQVGIEDRKYFREQFTALFGMTPSDYIRKYRQNFLANHALVQPDEPAEQ